jgi:hypothetical protein
MELMSTLFCSTSACVSIILNNINNRIETFMVPQLVRCMQCVMFHKLSFISKRKKHKACLVLGFFVSPSTGRSSRALKLKVHNSVLDSQCHSHVRKAAEQAWCQVGLAARLWENKNGRKCRSVSTNMIQKRRDFRLSAISMIMSVFWGVAPCSLVDIYRRFRGAYCLYHRPDDGGSMHLWDFSQSQTTWRNALEDSRLHGTDWLVTEGF